MGDHESLHSSCSDPRQALKKQTIRSQSERMSIHENNNSSIATQPGE